jgi:hypothetical protein
MIIQINSDNHIHTNVEFSNRISDAAKSGLKRFEGNLSRVDIYFADENKAKRGIEDKKCTIEAKLTMFHPEAVSFKADTLDEAFNGAMEKLKHLLGTKMDQLKDHYKH